MKFLLAIQKYLYIYNTYAFIILENADNIVNGMISIFLALPHRCGYSATAIDSRNSAVNIFAYAKRTTKNRLQSNVRHTLSGLECVKN